MNVTVGFAAATAAGRRAKVKTFQLSGPLTAWVSEMVPVAPTEGRAS